MKKLISIISIAIFLNPVMAMAVNITVPQSVATGTMLIGKANGNYTATTTGDGKLHSLLFSTTTSLLTNLEGLLQWNSTDGTLDLGMSGGDIIQQIGQELFIKVRNASGVTISNGTPVYFNGRLGNRAKIYPAKGDSETTSMVMGMTTQDILDNSDGFITTFGYVRQIKTDYTGTGDWGTTWAEGDNLYVSKTVAGQLTNVEPTAPNHSDVVGQVAIVGGLGIGSIFVDVDRHKTLSELSDVNGTPLTTTGQIPVWDNTNGYFDFTKNTSDFLPTGQDINITPWGITAGFGDFEDTVTISRADDSQLVLYNPAAGASATFYEDGDGVLQVSPGLSAQTQFSGNIGIGTTPTVPLQIFNASAQPSLRLDADNTTDGIGQIFTQGITNPNLNVWFGLNTSAEHGLLQAYKQGTGALPFILQPNEGNVGIGGTSTPYRKLSVWNGSSDLGTNALAGTFTATSTVATSTFAGGSTFATSVGSVGVGLTSPQALFEVKPRAVGTVPTAIFHSARNLGDATVNQIIVDYRTLDNTSLGLVDYLGRWFANPGQLSGFGPASIDASMQVSTRVAAAKGLLLRGVASQSGNMFETQNSTGVIMSMIDSAGKIGTGTSTPWGQLSASSTSVFPTLAVKQNSTGSAATFEGGKVGVGTSTPLGTLSVQGVSTVRNILTIASSTNATLYTIDSKGHHLTGGTSPTVSSCGTSPTIQGDDSTFRIKVGSGVVTTCLATFAYAWTNMNNVAITPACSVTEETAGTMHGVVASSTPTTVLLTHSVATFADEVVIVKCQASNNFTY